MSNRTLVPVNIRPHLIKYLYESFPAEKEAKYRGKAVKSVRVSVNSPLGKYIRSMCVKCDYPQKITNFNFFFSVEENVSSGSVYAFASGKYNFLRFPEEFIEDLNEMLESMFRMTFFYFVEGYKQSGKYGSRAEAIRLFIDRYDLFEHDFTFDALNKQFTRLQEENHSLAPLIQKTK